MSTTNKNYDFFPETNPEFGADPGFGNLYVVEHGNVLAFATEPLIGSAEGDLRKTDGDHTFAAGKGFRKISFYRGDSQTDGNMPGDPGFKSKVYEVKGFIAGSKAKTREFAENLRNKAVLVLQEEPNCEETVLAQHGCACKPVYVKDVKFTSGSQITGGKKGYEIIFESMCWFDYDGVVTMKA